MINIIGLGETGCKLADEFAKSDNYDVYKIGHGLSKTKRTRGIKKEKDPEKYAHHQATEIIIPATRAGRAEMWKTHYNTVKGKGTIQEYIDVNDANKTVV